MIKFPKQEKELNVSCVKTRIQNRKTSRKEEETNIFLQKYTVSTATKHISLRLYKGVLFDEDNFKISILPYSSLEIIIDDIKSFFGLESFNRQKIILPSQEIKMLEYHKGVERSLDEDEVHDYEVYKIKFFRWLIGLPHSHPRKDILVRIIDGYKKFISYKDINIDYSRPMSISIDHRYDFKNIFKEMTYGTESLPDLALSLNDIINKIDSSYIYISTHICLKINEYNFI